MTIFMLGVLAGALIGIAFSPLLLIRWLKKRDEVLIINRVEHTVYRLSREEAAKSFSKYAEGFKKYPLLLITAVSD